MSAECEVSGEACCRVGLLDTTFFIDLHRQDIGALDLWELIRLGEVEASYSAVTAFELWFGRLSESESRFYEGTMRELEAIALTTAAARRAAEWLKGSSGPVSERLIRDAFVASSAVERGVGVYTRNRRDFMRFAGVEVETY
jgi:predicted nucleic acid-binding protein